MGFPGMDGGMTVYIPPPPGAVELNLGDEWRARFVAEATMPKGIPMDYGYALLVMGDRGYVVRPRGQPQWGTVEAPAEPGEKAAAWAKRAAKEQANAAVARADLVGYLECRATSHNPSFPPGATVVRPIYRLVAKTVKDLGPDAPFERRRLPLNEYAMAIRTRYPELHHYLVPALDEYIAMRARGEV